MTAKEHSKQAKWSLGYTLGEEFHKNLDKGCRVFWQAHREIDHSFQQFENVRIEYGLRGWLELCHHLAFDYGILKPSKKKYPKCGEINPFAR